MDNDTNKTETAAQENNSDDRSLGEKISDYWNQATEYAHTHDLGSDYIANEIAMQHPELSYEQAREIATTDAMESGKDESNFTPLELNQLNDTFTYTPPDLNFMPPEDPFHSVFQNPFDQSMNNSWNDAVMPGEITTAESPDFQDPGFDVTATVNSFSSGSTATDTVDNSWMDGDGGTV